MQRLIRSNHGFGLLVLSVALLTACGPSGGPVDNGSDVSSDLPVVDVEDPDVPIEDVRDALDAREEDDGTTVVDVYDAGQDVPVDVSDVSDVADVADDINDAAVDVSDVADVSDTADVIQDEGPAPCDDDGLACTVEARGDDGQCSSTIIEGWCVISDACVEGGTVNPANICQECLPEQSTTDWTAILAKECDDGINCTIDDACDATAVCAGAPVVCPDDGESCTVESCQENDGTCRTTTLNNGSSCLDDGNQCTYDRCQGGVCTHTVKLAAACSDGDLCTQGDACDSQARCVGTPKNCPDDGNICTDNFCDPATGQCAMTRHDDRRPCEDYNGCTLNDGCRNGECTGDRKDCNDGDPCTFDNCIDGPVGECDHPPVLGACEDGDLCTRGETCNALGICQGGTTFECNDYNNCTDDYCDSSIGCVFASTFDYCDDTNPCTVDDICGEDGVCAGTPKDCDDGNDCTRDYCFLGNCHHDNEPDSIPCDDGDICTIGGTCKTGNCQSSADLDCSDTDPCTDDLCDPLTGCYTASHDCDDNNPCTNDECQTGIGCVYTPNSSLCNDNDPCTEADVCSNSVCAGTPIDCYDGDPCTIDQCVNGLCVNPPNTGECDDGNACTTGERCYDNVCTNGQPVDCYDFSDCTTDSCDPDVGCVNTPISGSCDDGTTCTLNDRCSEGLCVGDVLDCSDGNFCTNDLCHEMNGCYWENNAFMCDDGNPCTNDDQCGGGTCQGQNVFRSPLMKAGTYLIGTDGNAGNGLDVDLKSDTCSPANKCASGIDNAFAAMTLMVKDQFNPDLVTGVAAGDLAMFLEPESPGPVGSPFEMKVIFGEQTLPLSCNPATSGCKYLAFKGDTIGTCTAKYALTANTSMSHISAGGQNSEAVVYFMIGTHPMPVALKWARVEADVTISGNNVTSGTGILAGAINKLAFKNALAAVPEANFIHYSRSEVILNVDQNLPMDVDVDGVGGAESSTIGIKFNIVQGEVVGRTN